MARIMGNLKLLILVAIIGNLSTVIARCPESITCEEFSKIQRAAKAQIEEENQHETNCEHKGFVDDDNVFGSEPTYDNCAAIKANNARLHTVTAQIFTKEFNLSVKDYQSVATRCNGVARVPIKCRIKSVNPPKYRPIDGRGNNFNNPEYGAADTPFARFAANGYEDGINTVRKAKSGGDLPNPRVLVEKCLKPAYRAAPPELAYGVFALLTVLFITHDVHYQTPVQPVNHSQEIQCCTADRSHMLPPSESHPACLPITICKNDSVYEGSNVGCINFVRSERCEYTGQVQAGEIMNRATSYLDLSLLYGNHPGELKLIRLYKDGLLRMGRNNILPVDANGQYIPSMKRFTNVPMASIWPCLFARNHNTLARRLKELNPQWDDETLFQEARRINIAIFQYNLITSKAVEASISNIPINETYDATRNAATTLEFSIAYRMAHYYIHDEMLFQDANRKERRIKQSKTVGRIDLLEDHFDDALRGALAEVVNAGPYGDEITNRIGTNGDGCGVDIIALDIQRSRDQGLPSYVDVRREAGLKPEVNCFDDLYKVMDAPNVELLKQNYECVEDIDYYVCGILETYQKLGNPLVGPTFGAVIARQWDNFAGGDIYYYSNPKSPYPFTQAQIDAIHAYSISNLLCANSNMTETAQVWPYAPTYNSNVNPLVSCATFPPMNLTAWKV